jgi:hypothetical protein
MRDSIRQLKLIAEMSRRAEQNFPDNPVGNQAVQDFAQGKITAEQFTSVSLPMAYGVPPKAPRRTGTIFMARLRGAFRKMAAGTSRSFVPKKGYQGETFNLSDLRQSLAVWKDEHQAGDVIGLEQLLDEFEAKYRNNIPASEFDRIRQIIASNLADIERQRQAIIDRGAKEGKTIAVEALRMRMEKAKAEYKGNDSEAFVVRLDDLLAGLAERYGEHIPVDQAYRIMKDLEEGREVREDQH